MKKNKEKSNVKIKMMSEDDLKEHFSDFLVLFAENTRGHVIEQKIEDSYILKKANELVEYLEQNRTVLFGLFDRKKLIGFLWAYPRIFLEEKRMYINSLIIRSEYREKGYGQMLMREIERYTCQNDIFVMDVSTASFKTDAIGFYEEQGFKYERVHMRKALSKDDK